MDDPGVLDVFSLVGRIGRARYLASGFILFAIKHNFDRILAASFGYAWSPLSYWVFVTPDGIGAINSLAGFYCALILLAIPFMWMGTALTMRRLRDAGLPLWLVMLFFIPFLNLIFFIILAAIPSCQPVAERPRLSSRIGRLIPHGEFGSAAFGVVLTAILAMIESLFSTNGLRTYGWGLFVGIPFFLGLNSTMAYAFHRPRSLGKCLLVAMLSTALVGAALFAYAVERIIYLAMALPLALVIALFGGFIGYVLQKRVKQYPQIA